MDANTFIFGFSILIFVVGIIVLILTSRDYFRMTQEEIRNTEEGGPRAALFNQLYELLSEEEISPESKIKIEQIKKDFDDTA